MRFWLKKPKLKWSSRNHAGQLGTHFASSLPNTLSTHTLILLFIFLHYSDSLASSFPPSDDLLHCLLATQFNSRQLFLILCVPGTELRVIRSPSHLGAESSWTLPSHAQYLNEHKPHQFYLCNSTQILPDLLPHCPPWFWLSSFLTQKIAVA